MTAHWTNPRSFKGEKAAIACRRIKGRHTNDLVASEIKRVHSAFGLTQKVIATVTSNGSNFIKAFRVYEEAATTDSSEAEADDIESILSNGTTGGFTFPPPPPPHKVCLTYT